MARMLSKAADNRPSASAMLCQGIASGGHIVGSACPAMSWSMSRSTTVVAGSVPGIVFLRDIGGRPCLRLGAAVGVGGPALLGPRRDPTPVDAFDVEPGRAAGVTGSIVERVLQALAVRALGTTER